MVTKIENLTGTLFSKLNNQILFHQLTSFSLHSQKSALGYSSFKLKIYKFEFENQSEFGFSEIKF